MQKNVVSIRINSLYGSLPSFVVYACKTETLGTKNKSLRVPDLTYVFCIQNSDFITRIASLYGSQPSSVVLCIQNSDIMTRINSLYGSQTSPIVLCMQNSVISTSLLWSQTLPAVLCMQNNVISIRITSLY